MKTYNGIVSTNIERLAALADGIFAVAMTLLVLDLRVPVLEVIHVSQPLWVSGAAQSEQVLIDLLIKLAPRLLTYFMSFLTLGIFWVAEQSQLNHFDRTNQVRFGQFLHPSLPFRYPRPTPHFHARQAQRPVRSPREL